MSPVARRPRSALAETRRRSSDMRTEADARRQKRRRVPLGARGSATGIEFQGYPACDIVGNDVFSCFPQQSTQIPQDEWSLFIWNINQPSFIGRGAVDVYLWRGDSHTNILSWKDIPNSQGAIAFSPNDSWIGQQSSWTPGSTHLWPYYFTVVPAGTSGSALAGAQPQAIFNFVQTDIPSTLSAALASESAASASAESAALASSLSAAGLTSPTNTITAAPTPTLITSNSLSVFTTCSVSGDTSICALMTATVPLTLTSTIAAATSSGDPRNGGAGGLQHGNSDTSIPHWTIAVISVLGFLALLAAIIAAYYIMSYIRKNREIRRQQNRDSMGSTSPMLGAGAEKVPSSPATTAIPNQGSVGSTLDAADAVVMAEAFRTALRKPTFPSEEHSPSSLQGSSDNNNNNRSSTILGGFTGPSGRQSPSSSYGRPEVEGSDSGDEPPSEASRLMKDELASEGKAMQSVGSKKPDIHIS